MSFAPVKRPRDDEEDWPVAFGIHESKKSRYDQYEDTILTDHTLLPSQTSFGPSTTSFPAQPPGFDTGCSLSIPESFGQWREEKRAFRQGRRPPSLTVDTAMDVDMVESRSIPNGDNLSPWPASARPKEPGHQQPSPIPHHLISQSLTISGGRTATPIYGHFTLNMRPERMAEVPQTSASLCPPPTVEETDWWRKRRLPSPISESGDLVEERLNEPGIPVVQGQAKDKMDWPDSPSSMEVDDTLSNDFLQVPEKNIEMPVRLHDDDQMNTEDHTFRAEVVSQPVTVLSKGKISFAMGFRADCEKCQMKVPGHYSHIVRS